MKSLYGVMLFLIMVYCQVQGMAQLVNLFSSSQPPPPVLLSPSPPAAWKEHTNYVQQFTLTPHGVLDVENNHGNIEVVADSGDTVILIVEKYGVSRKELTHMNTLIEHGPDNLKIKSNPLKEKIQAGINYRLLVPAYSFIRRLINHGGRIHLQGGTCEKSLCASSNGVLIIQGIQGDIETHADNTVQEITNLQASLRTVIKRGSLKAQNIVRPTTIQSHDAHLILHRISDAQLWVDDDTVEAFNTVGNFTLRSEGNPRLMLTDLESADIQIEGGKVIIRQSQVVAPLSCQSKRAFYNLYLASTVHANLRINTVWGILNSVVPLMLMHERRISGKVATATVGNGGQEIFLKNVRGDINVSYDER